MSYYLADANGYRADFATITGLKHFRGWAEQHAGPIRDFIHAGETDHPGKLADALDKVTALGDEESMRVALAKNARAADGVLLLSDGANNSLSADDEGD